jgi:hypothetical protein
MRKNQKMKRQSKKETPKKVTNAPITTIEDLVSDSSVKDKRSKFLFGESFKNLGCIMIVATRGKYVKRKNIVCKNCGKVEQVETIIVTGIHPMVVDSWDRIIKPLNHPFFRMFAVGFEVADAYNTVIEEILRNKAFDNIPFFLFVEDDILIPSMPSTQGPFLELVKLTDKYDIVGGLYHTKGIPPTPLILGTPGEDNFSPRTDWKPGDIVECNGMGMGFTLMKRSLFEDPRLKTDGKWFKTQNEITDFGMISYSTQDLFFMKKAVENGYKLAVHTGIVLGHLDIFTGEVF